MGIEPILFVTETSDGPTRGIAELEGLSVAFERVFDEDKDDYSDAFEVRALPPEATALAVERDEIFGRWRRAFDAGQVKLRAACHRRASGERWSGGGWTIEWLG